MRIITTIRTNVESRLPVIPYRLGIIKQDLQTTLERDWDVQARKMHDNSRTLTKGNTYLVNDDWVIYMKRIMTYEAWWWWIGEEFMLMINRTSKWGSGPPDEEPKFECIGLPCNFIALDKFTTTHARVVAKDSVNYKAMQLLDHKKDNWFYKPTQYWKCTMHQLSGEVRLVGAALHVYTPVIRQQPEQWILYKDIPVSGIRQAVNRLVGWFAPSLLGVPQYSAVELFPELPMDVTYEGKRYTIAGYALLGASVYGHAAEMDVPLRLCRVPGELRHPCPEWKLSEKPVPPEVRAEWKYP